MIKLNLGCGESKRKGYLNVDSEPQCEPDVCGRIEYMECEDGSVDEIIFSHVLEHLDMATAGAMLRRFYQWLKPDGKLIISVPNLSLIAKFISEGCEDDILFNWLYGSGLNNNMSHRWGYTDKALKKALTRAGFTRFAYVEPQDIDASFEFHGEYLSINLACKK